MILFNNYNSFDSTLLESFNRLDSSKKNISDLRSKIEQLYINDDSYDYSTKGISWSIFDLQEGSMLEILID